MNKLNLP